jgi:hypothetical protein
MGKEGNELMAERVGVVAICECMEHQGGVRPIYRIRSKAREMEPGTSIEAADDEGTSAEVSSAVQAHRIEVVGAPYETATAT